jgi:hypothetical protein
MTYKKSTLLLAFLCFTFFKGNAQTAIDSSKFAKPVRLTAEEDHKRLLALLNITELRPGPSGNPNAPNAANSDESKANPFTTLPDPLILKNGQKVTSPKMWWNQRRAEIFEDFDREVYGRTPKNLPKVNWEIIRKIDTTIAGIPVVMKKLKGHADNSDYPLIDVNIDLTLATPAKGPGKVPVVMELKFVWPSGMTPPPAPKNPDGTPIPSWHQQVLEKGWGYAEIIPTSFQADNGAGLTQGIIGLVNKGQPRKTDDWGTLKAWAWGASRALDYFETDKAVDAKKVAVEGLSRYGKAALVTMAYDERFAIGFIGSSGAGGAKLHRRNFGEMVENLAGSGEYHWMCGNYLKYAGPLTANDLPVDSHELIALCAPRPVFIGAGSLKVEGTWIDAKGMFLGAVYASPVYTLLGKKAINTKEFPSEETDLTSGDLAYRQHNGGHTNTPNWLYFLRFANRYF